MTRIVLDPDDINQRETFTLTDGTVVRLDEADRPLLDRVSRQLHLYACVYEQAFARREELAAAGEPLDLEAESPLVLRVRQLQKQIRTRHRRSIEDLDLSLLLQTTVWTSSSGTTLELEKMTPTHRRNLVAWLERIDEELRDRFEREASEAERTAVEPREPWVAGTPLYRRLAALIATETPREQARDQARQVARKIRFTETGDWPDR